MPEGLAAPFVSASVDQPVLIAWNPPTSPNGVLLRYTVERRDQASATPTTIATLNASAPALVAGDTMTTPFTVYSYRVIAENSAGMAVSEYTTFHTPEAGKLNSLYSLSLSPLSLSSLSSLSLNHLFPPTQLLKECSLPP